MSNNTIFSVEERTAHYLRHLALICSNRLIQDVMVADSSKLTSAIEASFYKKDAEYKQWKIAIPDTKEPQFAGKWCPTNQWFTVPGKTIREMVEYYVADSSFYLDLIAGKVAIFGDADTPIQCLHCHIISGDRIEWAIEGLLFDVVATPATKLPYPVGYESYTVERAEESDPSEIASLIEEGSLPEGTTRAQLWALGLTFKNLVFSDGRKVEEAFFDLIYAIEEGILCFLPSMSTHGDDYPSSDTVDVVKTWEFIMPILKKEGICKDGSGLEYRPIPLLPDKPSS